MDVRAGPYRKLSAVELMLLNCGVGKHLRVPWTARRSNQSITKGISPEYSLEGLMWSWNSNTLATWCEELTHLKRRWCWERLKAGEGDNRGWDGWMKLPTQCTWVWVNSGSWWCHPTISSSVIPSSCLQSFPASASFQMSHFFTSGGQSIGVSGSASGFPKILRIDFL